MGIAEKTKIRIVYIAAAALIAAAVSAVLIFNAVFAGRMRSAADAVDFRLALRQVDAAVNTVQQSAALEIEQTRWDGFAAQREARLDERREELLLLVNPWNTVPEDLSVRLAGTERDYQVDVRCAAALEQMLADCREAGGSPYICSAYRTQDYQQMLFDNKVQRVLAMGIYTYEQALAVSAMSVAVPGTSEHQLGLAVDIIHEWYPNLDQWQQYTDTQVWLMGNSWRYGFILRYPNGSSDITGIIFEPWHYRYVGCETAKEIYEQGITLEEYLTEA